MFKTSLFSRKNKKLFLQSQYVITATLMLTTITRGAFMGWATTCIPVLKSEDSPIPINDDQLSWVVSSQSLGIMVSAIPVGILSDKYSYKRILMYTEFLSISSWAMLYMIKYFHNWELMLVSRIVAGVWIGVQGNVVPLYINEIAESHVRGFLNTTYQLFLRLGILYALIVGVFVPLESLPLMYAGFMVIFLLLLPAVPESPQYLLKVNDTASARESLQCIRPGKTDTEIETELKEMEGYVLRRKGNMGKFSDLLTTKHNRKVIFVVGVMTICQRCTANSYMSITLPKSTGIPVPILVIIIETIRTVSSFAASFVYSKTGTRALFLTSTNFASVVMFVAGLWYHMEDKRPDATSRSGIEGLYNWIPFICFLLQGVIYTIGIISVYSCVRSEYFPANIKGMCTAVMSTLAALVTFIVNKMYLTIANKYGLQYNFWFISVNYIVLATFAYWFLIETKGKTLQQVQDDLTAKTEKHTVDIKL